MEGTEPPAKRPRNDEGYGYVKNLELLQEEMRKDRSIALIQTLMEDTFTERLQESQPVVSDIEKFPSLKIRKVVSFLITRDIWNVMLHNVLSFSMILWLVSIS